MTNGVPSMNYIMEINRFYDWLETNQIPKSAIALWHGLMHIANKAGWEQSFTVAISTIESKTGFKKSDLCAARNILTQKGRIKWMPRGGSASAEYEVIPFCVHNTDTINYTKAYTNHDTKLTQSTTINKLNYTELIIIVGSEEKNLKSISELFEADVGLKMNWQQKGFAAAEFFNGIELWMVQNHSEKYLDLTKARKHFLFWMPNFLTAKEKIKANGNNKQGVTKPVNRGKSQGAYELAAELLQANGGTFERGE